MDAAQIKGRLRAYSKEALVAYIATRWPAQFADIERELSRVDLAQAAVLLSEARRREQEALNRMAIANTNPAAAARVTFMKAMEECEVAHKLVEQHHAEWLRIAGSLDRSRKVGVDG